MQTWRWAGVAVALMTASCVSRESQSLTAAQFASVSKSARAFAQQVANDITTQGPSAWRQYFAESPAFFMASEGRLMFSDSASASSGIQELSRTIRHIELKWGDDLRVDPLTPDLAMLAASWREIIENQAGDRVEEKGFFTGVAEQQAGRWRFRDAHWSVAAPARR